jgi:hypothetical protein
MRCRPGRQRAGCQFVRTQGGSNRGSKYRNIKPSFNVSLALAVLLVDWSTSHGFSRVFNPRNNPENAYTQGALSWTPHAALSLAHDRSLTLLLSAFLEKGERGFRTTPHESKVDKLR